MAYSSKALIVALYCVAMLNVPAARGNELPVTQDLPVAGGQSSGMQPGVQQPASTFESAPETAALKVGGLSAQGGAIVPVARVEELPAFQTTLVYLGEVPLLSVTAPTDGLRRAAEIAAQVNRLQWEAIDPDTIRAVHDGRRYAVVAGKEMLLVAVDPSIRLSRETQFSEKATALQIANRLRHHFGNLAALADVQGPPLASAGQEDNTIGGAVVRVFQGLASWYGDQFLNRRTSSGMVYRSDSLIAAHRGLPFGTMLRVTNLSTGRQVVVKVQDRGPFVSGRVLDLSERAARLLGMIGSGIARVRVEVMR